MEDLEKPPKGSLIDWHYICMGENIAFFHDRTEWKKSMEFMKKKYSAYPLGGRLKQIKCPDFKSFKDTFRL